MTVKNRIIFRADGNSRIGLGHVIRTLALVHMLRDTFECIFAIQTPDKALKEQILTNCHGIIILPDCPSSEDRFIHELNAYISDEEIVVLDGYNFGTDYQRNIKSKGAALVCIDDLYNCTFMADAVINQAGGVDASLYNTAPYTKLYLGPEYALLRPPFLKTVRNKTQTNITAFHIFICMGGADPDDHTLRVAKEIQKLHKEAIIKIVVGSAYKHQVSLNTWLEKNPQHYLYHNLSADALRKLMAECQVAVTSASGVSYEYAAVGGALFILQTANNQSSLYNFMLSSRIAKEYKSLPEIIRLNTIISTATALKKKQREVFAGQSPSRLKEIFLNLSLQTTLKLRQATEDDLMLLFNWANDPEVRKHSFNSAPIPMEIHTSWYNTKLNNSDSKLYIAEVYERPAAHIRFEIADQTATISYLISNEFRGKGLSHTVLLKGVKQLLEDRKDVCSVLGLVQKNNVASVRAFEKAGFKITTPDLQHKETYKFVLLANNFKS